MKTPPEKLNLRLPADLKAQLQAYADSTGISLNAACVLALRNFLPFAMRQAATYDKATRPPAGPSRANGAAATVARAKASPQQVARPVQGQAPPQRVGRNDPCPCGSGKKAKHCHPERTC